MIISTTNIIEGKKIVEYKGIVSGEAIVGTNVVKDMFASVRDIVGGRSDVYEKELKHARELAIKDMVEEATKLGATAILAVDLDYETVGGSGSMLMVAAAGTAVVLD